MNVLKFQIVVFLSALNALAPYLIIFNYDNPGDWHGIGIVVYGIIFPVIVGGGLILTSLMLKNENHGNIKKHTVLTAVLSTVSIILVLPILSLLNQF